MNQTDFLKTKSLMFCFWNEIEMYLEGDVWYIKNSQMADNFDFSSFMHLSV